MGTSTRPARVDSQTTSSTSSTRLSTHFVAHKAAFRTRKEDRTCWPYFFSFKNAGRSNFQGEWDSRTKSRQIDCHLVSFSRRHTAVCPCTRCACMLSKSEASENIGLNVVEGCAKVSQSCDEELMAS